MDEHISLLFRKYIAGNITSEEFTLLVNQLHLHSDEDLLPLLQQHWEQPTQQQPTPPQKDIREIMKRVRMHTEPQRRIRLVRFIPWYKVAAAIALLVLSSLSVYLYVSKQEYSKLGNRDIMVRAEKGERASVVLPDGTSVRLNSESSLSYKQDFGHDERHVCLTGEGYFKVMKDAQKHFIVHTKFLDVRVLGTEFNFYAYEKSKTVELTLLSGLIEVSVNQGAPQTTRLYPNEKALFDTQIGLLKVEKTSGELERAWARKELVFRSQPLADVLKLVERRYGAHIRLEWSEIKQETYSGVFDKENVFEVLNILKVHYGFEYKADKEGISISSPQK